MGFVYSRTISGWFFFLYIFIRIHRFCWNWICRGVSENLYFLIYFYFQDRVDDLQFSCQFYYVNQLSTIIWENVWTVCSIFVSCFFFFLFLKRITIITNWTKTFASLCSLNVCEERKKEISFCWPHTHTNRMKSVVKCFGCENLQY